MSKNRAFIGRIPMCNIFNKRKEIKRKDIVTLSGRIHMFKTLMYRSGKYTYQRIFFLTSQTTDIMTQGESNPLQIKKVKSDIC